MADIKRIDWNEASEHGIIEKINREMLHPLGLAITRNPETGTSDFLLIADDGEWTYGNVPDTSASDDDIYYLVASINSQDKEKG